MASGRVFERVMDVKSANLILIVIVFAQRLASRKRAVAF
jgi:hypothetical protein